MNTIKNSLLLLFLGLGIAYGQHKLPTLAYNYGSLEPFVDSVTMRIHYTVHHANYVNNLNKSLENYPDLKTKSLDYLIRNINKLPKDIQTSIQNNGGGHYNHSFFWSILAPAGTTSIGSKTSIAINKQYGNLENFKQEFEKAALSRFGSGWVWLLLKTDGKLEIISTPNQDNPYMPTYKNKGKILLNLDVWEHAYYLKYQSKRAAYAKAFWNIVNWAEVEKQISE